MAINKAQVQGFIRKNPVGVACLGVFLVLLLFFFWRSAAIPEAEARLLAANELADKLALNLKNSAQLAEQAQLMKEATAIINSRIIQSSTLATNLQYFYKIVAETGTKLLELRQSTIPVAAAPKKGAQPADTLVPIPFVVTVQGDYHGILRILRMLETGEHYCRVSSASLSPAYLSGRPPEEGEEVMLTLSLNLELLGVQS